MSVEPGPGVTSRYEPGPGSAVVAQGFWLVADLTPGHPWIESVWSAVARGDLDAAEEQCRSRSSQPDAPALAAVRTVARPAR